jgi:hypothetical protein
MNSCLRQQEELLHLIMEKTFALAEEEVVLETFVVEESLEKGISSRRV